MNTPASAPKTSLERFVEIQTDLIAWPDDFFLEQVNRLTPEQAAEKVTEIEGWANAAVDESTPESIEATDIMCHNVKRMDAFRDAWHQFHLKHVEGRSLGVFPTFIDTWMTYLQREKTILKGRAKGRAFEITDQQEGPFPASETAVMDSKFVSAANLFTPELAGLSLPLYETRLDLYEGVLGGTDTMKREDIKGLLHVAVRFKNLWDDAEGDPDFSFFSDLIGQTRILVEALRIRERGEKVIVAEDEEEPNLNCQDEVLEFEIEIETQLNLLLIEIQTALDAPSQRQVEDTLPLQSALSRLEKLRERVETKKQQLKRALDIARKSSDPQDRPAVVGRLVQELFDVVSEFEEQIKANVDTVNGIVDNLGYRSP
jgi:hypothetical protein